MVWSCIACPGTAYARRPQFCAQCGEFSTTFEVPETLRAEIDSEIETTDAAALSRQAASPHILPGAAPVLVGHGALVGLVGAKGSGKSTLACRVMDAVPGPVAYVSAEEPPGAALALRLRRLGIARPDFHILGRASVDQVATFVRRRRVVALAIDSVQAAGWSARDLRHLLVTTPALSLAVAVSQINAHGTPAGRREFEHELDVLLHVEGLLASLHKSRYQEVSDERPVCLPVLLSKHDEREIRPEGATVRELRLVRQPDVHSVAPPAREPDLRGDGA